MPSKVPLHARLIWWVGHSLPAEPRPLLTPYFRILVYLSIRDDLSAEAQRHNVADRAPSHGREREREGGRGRRIIRKGREMDREREREREQ